MQDLGRFVREQRRIKGLTQEQLGKAIGVDRSYISAIEKGERQGIGSSVLSGLASTLGVSVAELDSMVHDRPPQGPRGRIPSLPIAVPVTARASAGQGGGYVEDYVYVPFEQARGRVLRAFRISGSCMEPELIEGDVVIVDMEAGPRNGSVVAATILATGDFVVKRFFRKNGSIELRPNTGEPLVLDASGVRIDGVVVQMVRQVDERLGRNG